MEETLAALHRFLQTRPGFEAVLVAPTMSMGRQLLAASAARCLSALRQGLRAGKRGAVSVLRPAGASDPLWAGGHPLHQAEGSAPAPGTGSSLGRSFDLGGRRPPGEGDAAARGRCCRCSGRWRCGTAAAVRWRACPA